MGKIFIGGNALSKVYAGSSEVSKIIYNGATVYETERAYYLKFSSPSSFTLKTYNTSKNWDGIIQYSTDDDTWTTWNGSEISAASDGTNYVLLLRGTGNSYITGSTTTSGRFVFTGSDISCNGNIETLLDYEQVMLGTHPVMAVQAYIDMFRDCTNLVTAPDLPATTLTNSCYYEMFRGCTSLATAPALPATTLYNASYRAMFLGCTSLVSAPEISAASLHEGCCLAMFYGCTNLETLPRLSATTLTNNCYKSMFQGCTKIKLSTTQSTEYPNAYTIPSQGTGTTATDALTDMFTGTGGSFTGALAINTTYYTSNTIV